MCNRQAAVAAVQEQQVKAVMETQQALVATVLPCLFRVHQ
jgi:hypothetical protein